MIAITGSPAPAPPTAAEIIAALADLTDEQKIALMDSIGLTYNPTSGDLEVTTENGQKGIMLHDL